MYSISEKNKHFPQKNEKNYLKENKKYEKIWTKKKIKSETMKTGVKTAGKKSKEVLSAHYILHTLSLLLERRSAKFEGSCTKC